MPFLYLAWVARWFTWFCKTQWRHSVKTRLYNTPPHSSFCETQWRHSVKTRPPSHTSLYYFGENKGGQGHWVSQNWLARTRTTDVYPTLPPNSTQGLRVPPYKWSKQFIPIFYCYYLMCGGRGVHVGLYLELKIHNQLSVFINDQWVASHYSVWSGVYQRIKTNCQNAGIRRERVATRCCTLSYARPSKNCAIWRMSCL